MRLLEVECNARHSDQFGLKENAFKHVGFSVVIDLDYKLLGQK